MAVKMERGRSPKSKKSTFRKVSEWLHLWLGLISGIVVFVVCLTGALWVFRYEVWYFTEKYQRVEPQERPFLPPSVLVAAAKDYLGSKQDTGAVLTGISYGKPGRSANCTFRLAGKAYAMIYLDPYTAKVRKDKREPSGAEKFFIFVRAGHRFFWLPPEIGSPIVGVGCIVFLITLITGLIWWYPSKWTSKTREKSFRIKWNARWKRLNIDLHNVLGFYSFLFVIALTVTGIYYSFEWFANGMYRTLTWKPKSEAAQRFPFSDTTVTATRYDKPEDVIWTEMNRTYGDRIGRLSLSIPAEAKEPYRSLVQFGDGTLIYNRAIRYYDQRTLKELRHTGDDAVPYDELSPGEKVFRMNFDIHTGQILGLPTKIIAFLVCMIGAGLPVTGFIIWYNRKWGKKKRKPAGISVR